MTTLGQLEQEKQERNSTLVMIGRRIAKRLATVRVSYTLLIALAGWFGLILFLYFMRLLGFMDGR